MGDVGTSGAQMGRSVTLTGLATRLSLAAAAGLCASCGAVQVGRAPPAASARWLAQIGDDAIAPAHDDANAGGIARADGPRPQKVAQARRHAPAEARPSVSARRRDARPPAPALGPAPRPEARAGAVVAGDPAEGAARPAEPAAQSGPDERANRRIAAAQRLLHQRFDPDRPFVDEVLAAAGQGIAVPPDRNHAAGLLAILAARGQQLALSAVRDGDVVFFRDTLDLNGNRAPDDGVTLAAVVERVEADRLVLILRRAGRVRRVAADPRRPEQTHDEAGRVINTRLVQWPAFAKAHTTGALIAAAGRP